MMMKRNFQSLVVAQQLLILAAWAVQSVTDGWLPPEMRGFFGIESSVLEGEAAGAQMGRGIQPVWLAITFSGLLAAVGVVLFRRWGRTLFVLTSVMSLAATPFGGLYVDVGWTVLVSSAAGLIEGMLIALMYYSPLRRLFRGGGEI